MLTREAAIADLFRTVGRLDEAHRPIPCIVPGQGESWLAEDPDVQHAAAMACRICAALEDCRAYVTRWPEPAGVWGGILPPSTGVHEADRDVLAKEGWA